MNINVCNMVSIINNGQLSKKTFVTQRNKKSCLSILNVLWDEGFILGYKTIKKRPNVIEIYLKYQNGNSVIQLIKILSKPSLRVYYSVKQLWKLDSSKGLVIISTNQGFMTNEQCKKLSIGGEPFVVVK